MKYIKYIKEFFNSISLTPPKVGDYVILEPEIEEPYASYIKGVIGRIILIDESEPKYSVEFEYLPDYFWDATSIPNEMLFFGHELKYWSADEEELKLLLTTNKYNL